MIVAEVAYNFAPAEYRNSPAPFPETPDGQKEFLEEIDRLVMETPDGRGAGVLYGEPGVAPRGSGSNASGRGLFDANGNALPAIAVFDQFTRGKLPQPATPAN